jgi:hypothetical protein
MSTLEIAYQGVSKYLSSGNRDVFSKLLILILSQLQHPLSVFQSFLHSFEFRTKDVVLLFKSRLRRIGFRWDEIK